MASYTLAGMITRASSQRLVSALPKTFSITSLSYLYSNDSTEVLGVDVKIAVSAMKGGQMGVLSV